ncbi:MAG: flagellar hook-length control protein FliK [Firmicutes bacterium]|nr:flagellar hook-length control protein FliK [Bacillota bacterium]
MPERVLTAVRHLSQSGRGRLRLALDLDPPALGRVVVRLAWEDGVLRADFLVASHEARQAVEAFLPRLRESLAGLVHLAEAGVWVRPDTTASDRWQSAPYRWDPMPAAASVAEREADPVFRGRPHGGVIDCLV